MYILAPEVERITLFQGLWGEEIPTSMVWRLGKKWNGPNGHTGVRSPLAWDGNQKVRMIAEFLLGDHARMQGANDYRHPAKLGPAGPQRTPNSDSWIPIHCLPASKKQLPMLKSSLQWAPECEQRSSTLRWCIWFNIKREKIGAKRNMIAIMFYIFCVCSELIAGRKWT